MSRLEGFFDDDLLEEDDEDEQVDHPKSDDQEEDVEIEITPEVASKWRTDPAEAIKNEDDDKDFGKRVQKRISKLTAAGAEAVRQRDADRKQLAELVAYTQQVVADKADLERRLQERSSQSFAAQAKGAETEASLAQGEYKQAAINGDANAMADANSRITDAKVRASQLKRDSEAATEAAEAAKAKATEATAKAQEALKLKQQASQQQEAPQVPAKRINWFKQNPWFDANGTDAKSAYAIAINKDLMENGVEGDSDEYFDEINKAMKAKYPKFFGAEDKAERRSGTVRTERTSRDDSQRASPINGNKISLTKSQMDRAKSIGLVVPGDEKRTKINLIAYAKEIAKVEATKK